MPSSTFRDRWLYVGVKPDTPAVMHYLTVLSEKLDQITQAARIPPFIVIPGKYLDEPFIYD
jgi:hypothetical protein